MFEESTHASLFNILLAIFSQPQAKGNKPLSFDLPAPPADVAPSDLTYLFYLRGVCGDPRNLDQTRENRSAVEAFAAWLEDHTLVKDVWLANIEIQIDINTHEV